MVETHRRSSNSVLKRKVAAVTVPLPSSSSSSSSSVLVQGGRKTKMPKTLQSYFFSKFSKPPSPKSSISPMNSKSHSSATCRILPRCRVPRTTSFSMERGGEYVDGEDGVADAFDSAADRLAFAHFSSLYRTNGEKGDEQQGYSRVSPERPRFVMDLPPPPGYDRRYVPDIDLFRIQNPSPVRDKTKGHGKDPSPKTKGGGPDSNLLFFSDVDRFLLENFDSLFDQTNGSEAESENGEEEEEEKKSTVFFEPSRKSISDRFAHEKRREMGKEQRNQVFFESSRQSIDLQRDVDVGHSDRFFVTASRSSSLMEEAWLSSTAASDDAKSSTSTVTAPASEQEVAIPDDSVAVMTRSLDPYEDFRRSMKEMMEARVEQGEEADWDFMEELLFCYLNLNDKGSHRYILKAFADLVGSELRQSTSGQNRGYPGWTPEKGKVLDSGF